MERAVFLAFEVACKQAHLCKVVEKFLARRLQNFPRTPTSQPAGRLPCRLLGNVIKQRRFLSDERQPEVKLFFFQYALTLLNVYLQVSLLA